MHIKLSAALLIILIAVITLPLFGHLSSAPIQLWDEARLANSALEMSHNNNWIVPTIDGKRDYYGTKPALMIWLQALMIKLIGPNEIAIRLPAAFAAFCTCLLIFFFFTKKYNAPWLGLIGAAVLVTAQGYVTYHGTRTGDYDSLLTLFTTGYVLFFFFYIEKGDVKYLYITFILLILAALTKGVQGLIFLPALSLYAIYKKKFFAILKQKDVYIGIAGFLFFVIGYYMLREHYDPGYIRSVDGEELRGRFNTALDNHKGNIFFYINMMVLTDFHEWYIFIFPGIIFGILSKQKWLKEFTIYCAMVSFIYLLVISKAQTKVAWYLLPLYPLLSMLVGIFVYSIFNILINICTSASKKSVLYNSIPYVFLVAILIMPYKLMLHIILTSEYQEYMDADIRDMERFMKEVQEHNRNIDGADILNDGKKYPEYNIMWYAHVFSYAHRPIKYIHRDEIDSESKVVAYHSYTKKYIEDHYNTDVLQTWGNVTEYKLNGVKQQ